jgi:hypothetical protein
LKFNPSILAFIVFVVLLAVPPLCLMYTGNGRLLVPHFWVIFSFINGLTFIMISSILVIRRLMPNMYAQTFLAVTVVKMMGCMALALLFVLKFDVDKTVFLINFFYVYFLNTGFEVYVLLRNLRNQN